MEWKDHLGFFIPPNHRHFKVIDKIDEVTIYGLVKPPDLKSTPVAVRRLCYNPLFFRVYGKDLSLDDAIVVGTKDDQGIELIFPGTDDFRFYENVQYYRRLTYDEMKQYKPLNMWTVKDRFDTMDVRFQQLENKVDVLMSAIDTLEHNMHEFINKQLNDKPV